jgi:hypothetical protein
MWQPWQWASASNIRAVENARTASVECSRRLVERTEVELYVAEVARRALEATAGLVPGSQHLA